MIADDNEIVLCYSNGAIVKFNDISDEDINYLRYILKNQMHKFERFSK